MLENYVTEVDIGGKQVQLALWDTAGQEEFDRLRPLTYSGCDVFLICFAIDSPDSLDSVQEKVRCSPLYRWMLSCVLNKLCFQVDPRSYAFLFRLAHHPRWL